MHKAITSEATRGRSALRPKQSLADCGAIAVVLLLTLLFSAAIIAALQPPRLVSAAQSAIEGGL